MKLPPRLARELYWVQQRLRGGGDVRDRLDWLLETQWLSPKELRDLQLGKLRDLLVHSYATVPYYRQAMDEAEFDPAELTDTSQLRALPLLTRSRLRAHQGELVSSAADRATLQVNHSSGSTGQQATFMQDLDYRRWMRAHQLRTYGWCAGWQLGEPFMLLWGSEVYWSLRSYLDKFDNLLSNRREQNTFKLSSATIAGFCDAIAGFQPVLISTYANAIHLIAREAERRRLRVPSLRCIQTTSEPMPLEMRRRVADVWGCAVYDKYGMRETNIVCHESPHHEEMCIQAENVFVEFLGPDGSPCAPGERGRVVVTTLNNRSMPLIRYETSDIAGPVEGTCSSGIGLPRMSSVAGRNQDLILTPSGDHVDAYFFSYLLMRFSEIHWFQVVQDELTELRLRMFVPEGLPAERRAEIEDRIRHHTGYPFRLELELLDEMPDSNTGKFRLCVSNLSAEEMAAQAG